MATRNEKKLETRRRLISVALRLSSDKGFSQLSLREVAKGKFELRPVSSTARLIVHELTDGTGIRAEVVPVSPP